MAHGQANAEITENLSPTLNCNHEQPVMCMRERCGCDGGGKGPLCRWDIAGTIRTENDQSIIVSAPNPRKRRKYIVRRLIPIECCRLQGFPDWWGEIDHNENMSDSEIAFWEEVRKTHAAVIGKSYKPFRSSAKLIKWYNHLHTDSAEYKMWGNGIALPCALYVMEGVAEELWGVT